MAAGADVCVSAVAILSIRPDQRLRRDSQSTKIKEVEGYEIATRHVEAGQLMMYQPDQTGQLIINLGLAERIHPISTQAICLQRGSENIHHFPCFRCGAGDVYCGERMAGMPERESPALCPPLRADMVNTKDTALGKTQLADTSRIIENSALIPISYLSLLCCKIIRFQYLRLRARNTYQQ